MNANKVKELRTITDEIRTLNAQINDLKAQKSELEEEIIADMKESEMYLAQTPYGTVSIKETALASVKDWDAFEQYIYDNKALYLLQRRPSDPAYREEIDANGEIPGVETFNKISVSLTKAVDR